MTDFTLPGNSNGSNGLKAEFTASFNIELASMAQLREFLNVSANSGLFGVAASKYKFTFTGYEERMSAQVVCF
ncbi:hypothetical protein BK026_06590 [Alteromonas sp. V450]|nr:hypothetical protein BK026_06590 [Alteromonas sp. V450]